MNVLELFQDRFDAAEQPLARIGRRELARGAMKEPRPELPLQRGDGARDGQWRERLLPGEAILLELVALFALGRLGWRFGSGAMQYAWALGLPLLAALAWGIFAVPDDPSRSGHAPLPVPGVLRLLIEASVFGSAIWALFAGGARTAGWAFAACVLLLHALSLDRLAWLLRR